MTKIALITGSTDGIGRATAIALAREGYTIHILGRNSQRGAQVLSIVKDINPRAEHRFYEANLLTIEGNNSFLDIYTNQHTSLDLLVLNANIFPKKSSLGVDGIDNVFMISFLSRYMFSLRLDNLLKKGNDARVVHIGGATYIKTKMDYTKLSQDGNSTMSATGYGFLACNLFVNFANSEGFSSIPYEFYEPGIVNTNVVKSQSALLRFASRLMGMIEPQTAGDNIAKHIVTTNSQDVAGKFFNSKGTKLPKKEVVNGKQAYNELMVYCAKLAK